MKIKDIKPLKTKDWSKTSKGLDASDKDKKINMKKWKIHGMLMPDAIQVYTGSDGVEYLVTANEGDDKVWSTSIYLVLFVPFCMRGYANG